MNRDPIVEETRNARAKLFEECGEDLDTLLERLKEQEQQDRARLVSKQDKDGAHNTGAA